MALATNTSACAPRGDAPKRTYWRTAAGPERTRERSSTVKRDRAREAGRESPYYAAEMGPAAETSHSAGLFSLRSARFCSRTRPSDSSSPA